MIIAVDGTVASGKSSAARLLAQELGFAYINTGLMYRSVAAWARRQGIATGDQATLAARVGELRIDLRDLPDGQHVLVNGEDVTDEALAPDIGADVSNVADNPAVRDVLVREQRRLGRAAGNAVLDGRDIGSVVFPDAEVKFFVTASEEERARRRLADDRARKPDVTFEEVLAAVRARDARDRQRPVGALMRMPDAIEIDTTHNRGPQETVAQMRAVLEQKFGALDRLRQLARAHSPSLKPQECG
ncbi:MAG: (d)CMP kinase [bacterium]|nr:(d)CMP kinase [bacterium]